MQNKNNENYSKKNSQKRDSNAFLKEEENTKRSKTANNNNNTVLPDTDKPKKHEGFTPIDGEKPAQQNSTLVIFKPTSQFKIAPKIIRPRGCFKGNGAFQWQTVLSEESVNRFYLEVKEGSGYSGHKIRLLPSPKSKYPVALITEPMYVLSAHLHGVGNVAELKNTHGSGVGARDQDKSDDKRTYFIMTEANTFSADINAQDPDLKVRQAEMVNALKLAVIKTLRMMFDHKDIAAQAKKKMFETIRALSDASMTESELIEKAFIMFVKSAKLSATFNKENLDEKGEGAYDDSEDEDQNRFIGFSAEEVRANRNERFSFSQRVFWKSKDSQGGAGAPPFSAISSPNDQNAHGRSAKLDVPITATNQTGTASGSAHGFVTAGSLISAAADAVAPCDQGQSPFAPPTSSVDAAANKEFWSCVEKMIAAGYEHSAPSVIGKDNKELFDQKSPATRHITRGDFVCLFFSIRPYSNLTDMYGVKFDLKKTFLVKKGNYASMPSAVPFSYDDDDGADDADEKSPSYDAANQIQQKTSIDINPTAQE